MLPGCFVQFIYYVEKGFMYREDQNGYAVMNITDIAVHIHDAIHGHAAELEKVDLLLVHPRNSVFGVRQADERNIFLCPILLEGFQSIRTDCHDLGTTRRKARIVITHARQLRAAMRSQKAAQKRKQHGFTSAKAGKADGISIYIIEFKSGASSPGAIKNGFIGFPSNLLRLP
jgi:hypothetical protein